MSMIYILVMQMQVCSVISREIHFSMHIEIHIKKKKSKITCKARVHELHMSPTRNYPLHSGRGQGL